MKTFSELTEDTDKVFLKGVHGTHSGFKSRWGSHSWEKSATPKAGDTHRALVAKAVSNGYEKSDEKHDGNGGRHVTYTHKDTGKKMHAGLSSTSAGKASYYIYHK